MPSRTQEAGKLKMAFPGFPCSYGSGFKVVSVMRWTHKMSGAGVEGRQVSSRCAGLLLVASAVWGVDVSAIGT